MKKTTFHDIPRILAALLCLVVIGTMTISNASMFADPVGRLFRGESDFSTMMSDIAGGYDL